MSTVSEKIEFEVFQLLKSSFFLFVVKLSSSNAEVVLGGTSICVLSVCLSVCLPPPPPPAPRPPLPTCQLGFPSFCLIGLSVCVLFVSVCLLVCLTICLFLFVPIRCRVFFSFKFTLPPQKSNDLPLLFL